MSDAQVRDTAEALPQPGGEPRGDARPTRKPMALWDRVKFLILLILVWFILVWSLMANVAIEGFSDAAYNEVRTGWWVFVLIGLEVLRQVHFLISERSPAYYHFWTQTVFGGFERMTHRRLSDWTRFRLWRLLGWVFWIGLTLVLIGHFVHLSPVQVLFKAPSTIWHVLPFAIQIFAIIMFGILQFAAIFWFLSRGGVDVYYPDDIKTRFTDVWGQDQVLERVKENIIFLENPELIEQRGGYVPGGILLWGPPGTGKTLMAEAVAGETGKPYVFVDPGAFINMFFGVGVLKVKTLFRKLRRLALRYGGVIVFFDEADSLGNRGIVTQGGPAGQGSSAFENTGCHGFSYLSADAQWVLARNAMSSGLGDKPPIKIDKQIFGVNGAGGGGGGMGTLQALLTEISGLKKPRGLINRYVRRLFGMRPKPPPHYRILIMMATNMPSALDEALLRPGRIDRIYKVGYPSKPGRVRTYEGYFAKVAHELTPQQIEKLAEITPYTTGAKIKDLVNESLIIAIKDGRDVITWTDVTRAKLLKDAGLPEDVEYVTRERHAVAVHEACHAVVAYRTRRSWSIERATIEKGADTLGLVASVKPEDQFTRWRSDYEADILSSLASLAGERMFFGGDSSSGVSGDLEAATTVASLMEGFWGMGSTVSSYSTARLLQVGAPGGGPGGRRGQDAEAKARDALADRIEANLSTLLSRAEEMLREYRRDVLSLAHALESFKTITGEDVTAVMEHQPGPLVDGTRYADDAFIAELEAYHEAVARAHRENDKEARIPLPKPPEPVAAAVAAPESYGVFGNGTLNGPLNGPVDTPRYGPPVYEPPDEPVDGHN
jgi:cell division protease FtsH